MFSSTFLQDLQKQKSKLKETETVVTNVDGQRYVEKDSNRTALSPNTYGFVVDTKPDNIPVLITNYLYIGSQDCTASDVLEANNIQHVLSLGVNVQVDVDQMVVDCLDLPETDIKDVLKVCLPYIRDAVKAQENILVHCNAGVSRCSMVAIGYLMHYKRKSFDDAYSIVKSVRPAIRPNDGFKTQLRALTPGNVI